MSFCFPPEQKFSHGDQTATPSGTHLSVLGGELTLQSVAVCCSQMVISSMSNTWQERSGGGGREVTASGGPHPWVGSPSLTLLWFKPMRKLRPLLRPQFFHLQNGFKSVVLHWKGFLSPKDIH